MRFQDIIKEQFEREADKNWVMYLIRIDGRDFAKFYRLKDPKDINEWRKVLEVLTRAGKNTINNILGGDHVQDSNKA